MRRLSALLLLTPLLGLGLTIADAPPAHAAAVVRIHEFNMSGWVMHGGSISDGLDSYIQSKVQASHNGGQAPWIIALNEVCESQYVDLVNNRGFNPGGFGVRNYFVVTKYSVGPACGNYGIAIFTGGVPNAGGWPASWFEYMYPDPSMQYQGSSERRKLLCNRSIIFPYEYVACTTHLDSHGIPRQPVAECLRHH